MLGCVTLFGPDRGAEVQLMVEAALGGPCPCKLGKVCPLLPLPEGQHGGDLLDGLELGAAVDGPVLGGHRSSGVA